MSDDKQPTLPKMRYPYKFCPLLITVTPEVQELLNSKEAKFYLGHIKNWSMKLVALFERDCKGNAITGALDFPQPEPLTEDAYEKIVPLLPQGLFSQRRKGEALEDWLTRLRGERERAPKSHKDMIDGLSTMLNWLDDETH